MRDDDTLARLRKAFQAAPRPRNDQAPVPADELVRAVSGDLAPERVAVLVDRLDLDRDLAEEWALVRAMGPRPAESPAALAARVSRHPWRARGVAGLVLALAAGLALSAGVWWTMKRPAPVVFRAATQGTLRSLLPEGQTQSRGSLVLRWSGGPQGARYDVRVLTEDLDGVAEASGLTEPSLPVAPEALAPIPPGGTLLWQVDAVLDDGTREVSTTFRTVVD